VIGICGGFQMLGRCVDDPDGVEGAAGTIGRARPARLVDGADAGEAAGPGSADLRLRCGVARRGGEGLRNPHGRVERPALARPAFEIDGRGEGACSDDGQILGSYLHGMFDEASACAALLRWAGLHSEHAVDAAALREASLDRIADAAAPLLARLLELATGDSPSRQ
jgi:adenosylcobyric acid synthase